MGMVLDAVSVVYPGSRAGEEVHALESVNLGVDDNDFVVALAGRLGLWQDYPAQSHGRVHRTDPGSNSAG